MVAFPIGAKGLRAGIRFGLMDVPAIARALAPVVHGLPCIDPVSAVVARRLLTEVRMKLSQLGVGLAAQQRPGFVDLSDAYGRSAHTVYPSIDPAALGRALAGIGQKQAGAPDRYAFHFVRTTTLESRTLGGHDKKAIGAAMKAFHGAGGDPAKVQVGDPSLIVTRSKNDVLGWLIPLDRTIDGAPGRTMIVTSFDGEKAALVDGARARPTNPVERKLKREPLDLGRFMPSAIWSARGSDRLTIEGAVPIGSGGPPSYEPRWFPVRIHKIMEGENGPWSLHVETQPGRDGRSAKTKPLTKSQEAALTQSLDVALRSASSLARTGCNVSLLRELHADLVSGLTT